MRLISMLLIASSLLAQTGSDTEVKGAIQDLFVKSRGQSLLGKSVAWHVPAKVFAVPTRRTPGLELYVSRAIGLLLVDAGSDGVAEVRRRGGAACIRGRVVRVPPKDRRPGDPEYEIVVTSITHRKS